MPEVKRERHPCSECGHPRGSYETGGQHYCQTCWNDMTVQQGKRDHDVDNPRWAERYEQQRKERDEYVRNRNRQ